MMHEQKLLVEQGIGNQMVEAFMGAVGLGHLDAETVVVASLCYQQCRHVDISV